MDLKVLNNKLSRIENETSNKNEITSVKRKYEDKFIFEKQNKDKNKMIHVNWKLVCLLWVSSSFNLFCYCFAFVMTEKKQSKAVFHLKTL